MNGRIKKGPTHLKESKKKNSFIFWVIFVASLKAGRWKVEKEVDGGGEWNNPVFVG